MKSRRLLIMPAHNEAKNLPVVFGELCCAAVPDLDILVVDDYSSDNTAEVARAAGATVISLPCNLGYGGAVQTGFRYAIEHGYPVAALMDADGQHDPSGLKALFHVVESGQADVALGSRFLGQMQYEAGMARRLGIGFFRALVSQLVRQEITDPTSGYQALSAEVMSYFARDNYPTDYPDADTILLLKYAGFTIREVPVTMRERLSGRSMHASLKPIYYVAKMILAITVVLLRQGTHANALRPGRAAARL